MSNDNQTLKLKQYYERTNGRVRKRKKISEKDI